MRDLIKLIKNIDKVIALFLAQKKIGVTKDILQESSVDLVLANLLSNINYYKNLPAPPSVVPQSVFWKATHSVVSGLHTLYQTTESTLRFLTNTDSRYRLDTIAWLNWTRKHFAVMAEQSASLGSVADLRIYADNLKIEIRAFFGVIERILNDTLPDEKSAFRLERENKVFLIYGLKGSASDLGVWFRQYLVGKFKTPVLIESILDECRDKCEVLVARTEQQALIAEHREPLMATIRKLQENNAVLERELAYTNRIASQYQAELQDSQARSSSLMQDLALKESQERAYEESIKRLVLEKDAIELRQQTQRTEDPQQNELLRAEIETMRRRLELAVREKEGTQAEINKLALAVQTEHLQQEDLRLQLERVNQEKEELAREMPAVVEDVNELDEDAMVEILQPYAHPEESDAGDYDEEDYDEIDLDLLNAVLRQAAQESQLDTPVKRPFPLKADEVENGCTSAQNHVMRGKVKYLQDLLSQHHETVNTVCKSEASPLGNKTLLELAMFHVNLLVMRRTRKLMVELILKFRPIITNSTYCVFDIIKNRINDHDKCDLEIRELFCQYAIAQKTCSQEARAELVALMEKAESAYALLLTAPHATLVEGKRCDALLRELEDSIKICRLLRQGYIDGNFSVLDPILKRETAIDYAELQEILYDVPMKHKADQEYRRIHGRSSLRSCLLEIMEPRIIARHAVNLKKSVVGKRETDEVLMGDGDMLTASMPASIKKQSFDPAYEKELIAYGDLLMSLSNVLVRYGVVLSAKGFNRYQIAEIQLQLSLENDMTAQHQQDHQPYAAKFI